MNQHESTELLLRGEKKRRMLLERKTTFDKMYRVYIP